MALAEAIRPGVYSVIVGGATGEAGIPTPSGDVAVALRSHAGPLGVATQVFTAAEVTQIFGTGLGTEVARNAIRGGAQSAWIYRVGTSGTAASLVLKDTNGGGADVATLTAKNVGDVDLGVVLRDDPQAASTKRQLVIYRDGIAAETWVFAKGSDEIDSLVTSMTADGDPTDTGTASTLLDIEKTAAGNGTFAALSSPTALTGGVDPTVANGDYTTAVIAFEGLDIGAVVVDSETAAVHTAVQTQVATWVTASRFVFGFVGEPPSVDIDDRITNASALNHEAMVYVGSDFYDAGDVQHDGAEAAGMVAGMVVSSDLSDSLTWNRIPTAVRLGEVLSDSDQKAAIAGGVLTFSRSELDGSPRIEAGINTLVTLSTGQDSGWRKIKRTRVRFEAIRRSRLSMIPMIGNVINDEIGRGMVVSRINSALLTMVADRLLTSAVASITSYTSDSVTVALDIGDNDSIERVYLNIAFAA